MQTRREEEVKETSQRDRAEKREGSRSGQKAGAIKDSNGLQDREEGIRNRDKEQDRVTEKKEGAGHGQKSNRDREQNRDGENKC